MATTRDVTFGNGFLTGDTSVFVELKNVLLHTDGACLWLLYQMLEKELADEKNTMWLQLFPSLLETCRSLPPYPSDLWKEYPPIYVSAQSKQEQNPLLDFIDYKAADKFSINPISYCNATMDWLWTQLCTEDFNNVPITTTGICRGLGLLMGDSMLKKMVVYCGGSVNDTIKSVLYQLFRNPDKLSLVTGPFDWAIQKSDCNAYFFGDVSSLQYLRVPHEKRNDAYLLEYNCNVLRNPKPIRDEFMADDTIILPDTTSIDDYRDKYNVYVNIIKIPV